MRKKKCLLCIILTVALLLPANAFAVVPGKPEAYAKVDYSNPSENTGMTHIAVANKEVERAGRKGMLMDRDGEPELYILLDVDDEMMYAIPDGTPIEVTVEYFDEGDGRFELTYDGYDASETMRSGIWADAGYVDMTDSKEWKTHTFYTEHMRMTNLCDGADMRLGVFCLSGGGRSPGSVVVGSVTMRTSEYHDPLRLISVTGNKPGNIYAKGENVGVDLNFENKSDDNAKGTFSYTVKSEDGKIIGSEEGITCDLPPWKETALKLNPPEGEKYGRYFMKVEGSFEYTDGKDKEPIPFSADVEYSLAWEVEKEDINEKYGTSLLICEFDWSAKDGVAAGIAGRAGIGWGREEIRWSKTELLPGVYKIPDNMRRELEYAKEAGMKMELGLLYSNPVAYKSFTDIMDPPTTDEELTAYGNWCEWLARETKGLVYAFAVWNEYNLESFNSTNESPEHYAKILETAYKAVKKGNPDAIVLGLEAGSIDPSFNDPVYGEGGLNYMDVMTCHPYDWSGHFDTKKLISETNQAKETMRKFGKEIPIWWTEFGFVTMYTIEEQRNNLVLMYALSECYDLADVSIQFRFQDDLRIGGLESGWGLLWDYGDLGRENGAKPSYLGVCAMNHLIGANAEAKDVINDGTNYALRFYNKKMGKDVVLLSGEYDASYMRLNLGVKELEVYDVYGNKLEPVVSETGVYDFSINKEPFYVVGNLERFEQADSAQAEITPICVEDTVIPGETITFSLQNKTGKRIKVVSDETDAFHIEKISEAADGTVSVTLRTSENLTENTYADLIVLNEKEQVIYRGKGLIRVSDKPIDIAISTEPTSKGSNHWRARVEITNLGRETTLSGTLRVLSPEKDAEYNKPRSLAALSPRETRVVYLNLPFQAVKNSYSLELQVSMDNGYETTITEPIDFTIAKYAEKKPTIDGVNEKGEWSGVWFGADNIEHYGSDDYSGNKIWRGPDDSSFLGTTMWDEENLYLMIYAKDDIHYTQYEGGPVNMWRTDGIQFALDDRPTVNQESRNSFTEVGVADVPGRGAVAIRYSSHSGLPISAEIENCSIAVKHEDGHTVYECAFPWSELVSAGFVPKEGQRIRFSMVLNDSDTGSRGWIMYNGGIAPEKKLDLFGYLNFGK